MSGRTASTKLLLTDRAVRDLAEIEAYSRAQWGKQTAVKYIGDLEAALLRLREDPSLLRPETDLHADLCFYRVNKHLLVCDVHPQAVFLLTVIHASRDIPSRLAEMQPTLAAEVELLHNRLGKRRKR